MCLPDGYQRLLCFALDLQNLLFLKIQMNQNDFTDPVLFKNLDLDLTLHEAIIHPVQPQCDFGYFLNSPFKYTFVL